ncbi:hypothetical protein AAF712_006963 [Marasmius tenuissimus]|uniref:BZIP domain-containing protein n=1 Tax=Marasmius tenuissimus TaxID=585030 RepID=A0ABR2ZXT9_9AGAR
MPRKKIYHTREEKRLANNAKAKRWRDKNPMFIGEQREAKKRQDVESRARELREKRQRALKKMQNEAGEIHRTTRDVDSALFTTDSSIDTAASPGPSSSFTTTPTVAVSTKSPTPEPTNAMPNSPTLFTPGLCTANPMVPSHMPPPTDTTSPVLSTTHSEIQRLFDEACWRYKKFSQGFPNIDVKVAYLEELYQRFRTPIPGEGYWDRDEFFGQTLPPYSRLQAHLRTIETQLLNSYGRIEEWRKVCCFVDDVSDLVAWIEDLYNWGESIIEMDWAHSDKELKYRKWA